MIRVAAPCRLHFGLIHPAALQPWANVDGTGTIPGRRFGGCGVMLDQPQVQVVLTPAPTWSATGPGATRALLFARRFADTLPAGAISPQQIVIEQMLPEHCGFGSGTQLALAIARALASAAGHADWGAVELARRVGRGMRSAIGVHGFQHGGFVVDGGKLHDRDIAPLIAQVSVPGDWCWLLLWPRDNTGVSGAQEHAAMERLASTPAQRQISETLCRLLLLTLLPALVEHDFPTFATGLEDYNARAGDAFAAVQGGRYAPGFASSMIPTVRRLVGTGVGQSSWGELVFAVLPTYAHAEHALQRLTTTNVMSCIAKTFAGHA